MQILLGSLRLAVLIMAVATQGVAAAEAGHPTTLVERRLDGWMSRLLHYEHGRAATSYPASPPVAEAPLPPDIAGGGLAPACGSANAYPSRLQQRLLELGSRSAALWVAYL